MTPDFKGKVALVTGASRGIGHAIAAELARGGAAVTISSRKADQIEAAADELRALVPGARVLAVPANTGSDEDRAEVVRRTVEEFGSLDVLINNTGINPTYGPLADADLNAVRKLFDVNVVGALGYVQLALKAWMAEHGGSIVNIASVAGLRSSGRDRRVRREQGGADPAHRGAGLAARPRRAGQRGRAGGGEDEVRRGALHRRRGGGGRPRTR